MVLLDMKVSWRKGGGSFFAGIWELVKLLAEGDAEFRAARISGGYRSSSDVIDLRSSEPEPER